MFRRIVSPFILFVLFLSSCNLPVAEPVAPVNPPQSVATQAPEAGVDVVGTAVELTASARLTEIAGSAVPPPAAEAAATATFTPTVPPPAQCSPMLTATTAANVRNGPSTDYEIVGFMDVGTTAAVAGRNDANSWWYISYASAPGGYAWIAASVSTASCLPASVTVIPAPALADSGSSGDDSSSSDDSGSSSSASEGEPDLVVGGMMVHPDPSRKGVANHIKVNVTNRGDARAKNFTVQWYSSSVKIVCTWDVANLAPGASKDLDCSYTYQGCSTYTIMTVVDGGGTVDESNEGNNTRTDTLVVACH